MTQLRFPSFVQDLPLTRRALEFAAERHQGQRRDADHAAFILHPLEVAQLLRNLGYRDDVVAAAVLHDILEDTNVTSEELDGRFGPSVAELVRCVSEPAGGGSYAERKARLRDSVAGAGPDAAAVFAADKIAKARELRLNLVRDWAAAAEPGTAEKLEHYWACLAVLERMLIQHPLVEQLRFELEALTVLPPQPPSTAAQRVPDAYEPDPA